MDIPWGESALEMNALPALGTIPNYHMANVRKALNIVHTVLLIGPRTNQFEFYNLGAYISTICDHHFGAVLHAAVTKFGVLSFVLMHVFIVNHGAAIDASPVCYLTSHIHGYRFSNLTLARIFAEVPSVMAPAPRCGPPRIPATSSPLRSAPALARLAASGLGRCPGLGCQGGSGGSHF